MQRRCFARRARRGGAKRAVLLRSDAVASRRVRVRLRFVVLGACRLGAALGGDGRLRPVRSGDGRRRCVRYAGADHPDRGVPCHRLGRHRGASAHGRRDGARCGSGVRDACRRSLRACEPSVRTRWSAPCRSRGCALHGGALACKRLRRALRDARMLRACGGRLFGGHGCREVDGERRHPHGAVSGCVASGCGAGVRAGPMANEAGRAN